MILCSDFLLGCMWGVCGALVGGGGGGLGGSYMQAYIT
jgi:hypothetical protein